MTRINWVLDATVFLSALLAGSSGLYFLFLPSGGYQGGRNPWHGITIIFDRHTWDDIHTWGSVVMIIAIIVHVAYHWQWVKSMTNKLFLSFRLAGGKMSLGAKLNLFINIVIATSFLLTAATGVYFLFSPTGGFQGGKNPGWDPMFLFARTTWDLIHTWSGVAMIVAAILHVIIHWRWIKNVTTRFFLTPLREPMNRSYRVVEEERALS
jgi:hypothetical protein